MAAVPTHSIHRSTIYDTTNPGYPKTDITYYWDDKHISARKQTVDKDGIVTFERITPNPKSLPRGMTCYFCAYGSPYEPHVYEFV